MAIESKRLSPYMEMLTSALEDLRQAFIGFVNEQEGPGLLNESIVKLENVRRIINSAENIGIVISIGQFQVIPFELTGNIQRDLGQKAVKLPES